MRFYWVNVGLTIKEVRVGNFLWAPESTQTKSGKVKHLDHWDNVAAIRKGDLVFCCHDKSISYIAIATADAYQAPRPAERSFSTWGNVGSRVDVSLHELQAPLARDDIAEDFISRFDARCVPRVFTSGATLKQIYMASLPADAGVYLLEMAEAIGLFEASLFSQSNEGKKVGKTVRDAIVKARIGQGAFRAELLRRWNRRCSLTGLSNTDLLVASHIHAWSLCSNDERIDPENGLLLAAHIDRLFDRGLISFDDGGALLISQLLTDADRALLALDRCTKLRQISPGNRKFLARHRAYYGFE
ncbi:HNH endonuclease [Pandoraea pnomenusa]|uniref:HNH endonuclease n=1 Tax=Pandoraea pnomenusa TaxID=93220 RepID=UPI00333EA161